MRKENVFLVSGRKLDAAKAPEGPVINRVICARDDDALEEFVASSFPDFIMLSSVTLEALDQASKQIKGVLQGTNSTWELYVEPALQTEMH